MQDQVSMLSRRGFLGTGLSGAAACLTTPAWAQDLDSVGPLGAVDDALFDVHAELLPIAAPRVLPTSCETLSLDFLGSHGLAETAEVHDLSIELLHGRRGEFPHLAWSYRDGADGHESSPIRLAIHRAMGRALQLRYTLRLGKQTLTGVEAMGRLFGPRLAAGTFLLAFRPASRQGHRESLEIEEGPKGAVVLAPNGRPWPHPCVLMSLSPLEEEV